MPSFPRVSLGNRGRHCKAGGAAAAHAGVGGTGLGRTGIGEVHEEAELVVDVQLRVGRFAKADPVALVLLVILAVKGSEGGAALVLSEAFPEIGVEFDTACLGLGTLRLYHLFPKNDHFFQNPKTRKKNP